MAHFAMLLCIAAYSLLAQFAAAIPASPACTTVTSKVIVPTTTYTFLSTSVVTTHATTPHLATWTDWVVVPVTKTLRTITTTVTDCTVSATITSDPVVTVFAASSVGPSAYGKRELFRRQAGGCTITMTTTTTYGATETWVPTNKTSTYTEYTAWSLSTIRSTTSKGTTYTVATTFTTVCQACGPTVSATTSCADPSTTTLDARCSPISMTSAAAPPGGTSSYGLSQLDDTVLGGAIYRSTTPNASTCCQLCVEQEGCAGSAWDSRSLDCHLEFTVDTQTGELNCGTAAQAYYDYGPVSPMLPGTGWWLAPICGHFTFAAAKPDDGT